MNNITTANMCIIFAQYMYVYVGYYSASSELRSTCENNRGGKIRQPREIPSRPIHRLQPHKWTGRKNKRKDDLQASEHGAGARLRMRGEEKKKEANGYADRVNEVPIVVRITRRCGPKNSSRCNPGKSDRQKASARASPYRNVESTRL